MALQAKYLDFLANPSSDFLATTSSIHYVPTLTSINEAAGILKHLRFQQELVTKKEEKILNAFESSDNLCLETDTTLNFVDGGGTYLPGLDDNFLAGKIVNIVILHVVSFDAEQKIVQVRLHWDQGSLLKAVDTIGARGRSWPINLGKDQALLIGTSSAAAPNPSGGATTAPQGERVGRTLTRGVDPASSLSLFERRDPNATPREESQSNVVAPRQSAKPAPREWGELFVGGEAEVGATERSPSPSKMDNPLKAGAGKHYKNMRIFNPEDEAPTNKGIRTDSKKYDHFEFGEAEFQASPIKHDRTKHMSQWDFNDFATPAKAKQRATAYQGRSFDFTQFGDENEAEAKKPLVWSEHNPKPRQDAYSHFEITDSMPANEKPDPPLISRNSLSQTLYHDRILGEEAQSSNITAESSKQPLGNITNVNAAGRQATWETHWESTDAPTPSGNENIGAHGQKNVSGATQKDVRGTDSGWQLYDGSSEQPQKQRGIKILGNGSGGSKEAEKGWWDYSE